MTDPEQNSAAPALALALARWAAAKHRLGPRAALGRAVKALNTALAICR